MTALECLTEDSVAPHTGAWIEICKTASSSHKHRVAPHTGAWIEMAKCRINFSAFRCLLWVTLEKRVSFR